MENFKVNMEKLCSFYVNEWHLVTMILPYINKELNEKANIITILENDIEDNVKTLMSKLNLKNEKRILEIDWKGNKEIKYDILKEKFNQLLKEDENLDIIFVNGSKDYIDLVNYNISKIINENETKLKNKEIKLVNCYEVTEFNNSIKDILDTHSKLLNTAGEKYIEEVFDGYERKMA